MCFVHTMLPKVLISLTVWGFVSSSASAEEIQCTSQLLKNITDDVRSSIIVTLINNAKNLLEDAKKYATVRTRFPVATSLCDKPMDCAEILEKNPFANSGVYKVWPRSRVSSIPVDVYCDMEDDGGAWTVLQRRGNFDSGKEYFYKDWQSYKKGFGDPTKDFWLGNDNIFALTNQRRNIAKFFLTDWEGNQTYATFDEFYIDDESRKYAMHVSDYRGTAGDSFSGTNGLPFTTKDQDNDTFDKNCAVQFKGAWWYSSCHSSNLNGMYLKGAHESHADGVEWHAFRGHYYSLKDTVIKIRPKDFQKNPEYVTPH